MMLFSFKKGTTLSCSSFLDLKKSSSLHDTGVLRLHEASDGSHWHLNVQSS